MLRTLILATLLLGAAAAAGCIAPPEDDSVEAAAVLPPAEPDGKMTVEEDSDQVSSDLCLLGGLNFPGPEPYCATRRITMGGALTLTTLPVTVSVGSADVAVMEGDDGEWLVEVVVVGRGATASQAESSTQGVEPVVDIGTPGAHQLLVETQMPEGNSRASVDVLVHLPAGTLYDLVVESGSGDVMVTGLRASTTTIEAGSGDIEVGDDFATQVLSVETGSGDMSVDAAVRSAALTAGSGDIAARLVPTGSGTLTLGTGSGDVTLGVPNDKQHGYDITVTTGSGDSEIALEDGEVRTQDEDDVAFRSNGFASRAIRSVVVVTTGSGDVAVTASK